METLYISKGDVDTFQFNVSLNNAISISSVNNTYEDFIIYDHINQVYIINFTRSLSYIKSIDIMDCYISKINYITLDSPGSIDINGISISFQIGSYSLKNIADTITSNYPTISSVWNNDTITLFSSTSINFSTDIHQFNLSGTLSGTTINLNISFEDVDVIVRSNEIEKHLSDPPIFAKQGISIISMNPQNHNFLYNDRTFTKTSLIEKLNSFDLYFFDTNNNNITSKIHDHHNVRINFKISYYNIPTNQYKNDITPVDLYNSFKNQIS